MIRDVTLIAGLLLLGRGPLRPPAQEHSGTCTLATPSVGESAHWFAHLPGRHAALGPSSFRVYGPRSRGRRRGTTTPPRGPHPLHMAAHDREELGILKE